MKKFLWCMSVLLLASPGAQAAPGEFWELTSSMEGMGMAMPSQTSKECLPLKDDGLPAGMNDDCKVTDLKRIANGVTWKMSCRDGTTGSGRQTRSKDTISSEIVMHSSDGSMKVNMQGKRIGGSCDTGEKMKAVMAEVDKSCDLAGKKASEVVLAGELYTGKDAPCASRKEQFCSLVRRDLSTDTHAYQMLAAHQQEQAGVAAIKGCGLNVESARKSLCQANASNRSELRFLESHCPGEAKALREQMRAEACAGRQFTSASGRADCLAGVGTPREAAEPASAESPAADALNEGKKALKGIRDAFGF